MKIFSKISTPRLILQPITLDDAKVCFESEQASIKELSPYWIWAKSDRSIDDVKKFIRYALEYHKEEFPEKMFFSVFSKKDNKFLGLIWLEEISWHVPYFEIDCWLDTRETGKGYATEAINALSRACFTMYDAKRIQGKIFLNNNKSKSILEKLKFKLEGELENYFLDFVTRDIRNGLIYSCCNINSLPFLEIDIF